MFCERYDRFKFLDKINFISSNTYSKKTVKGGASYRIAPNGQQNSDERRIAVTDKKIFVENTELVVYNVYEIPADFRLDILVQHGVVVLHMKYKFYVHTYIYMRKETSMCVAFRNYFHFAVDTHDIRERIETSR